MKRIRLPGAIAPFAIVLLTACSTTVDPGLGEGAFLRDLRAVEAERRGLEAAARKEAAARDGFPPARLSQADRLLELRDRRQELVRDGLERATPERSETVTEAALVAFLAEVADTPLPAALWSESSESCPDLVADDVLFDLGEAILADDRPAYASALARVACRTSATACSTATSRTARFSPPTIGPSGASPGSSG